MSDIIDQISSKQNILPGPAAFRPRGHPASAYTPLIEKGRPVLQGLLAIDFLAKEVNFYFFLRKRFVLQSIKSSAAFRYEYIFLLFGFFFHYFEDFLIINLYITLGSWLGTSNAQICW